MDDEIADLWSEGYSDEEIILILLEYGYNADEILIALGLD